MIKNKKHFTFYLFIFLISGFFGFGGVLHAVDITVTTTQDNVAGSLRAAITFANSSTSDTNIYLPVGRYVLSGVNRENGNLSGDLDLNNSTHKISIIGTKLEHTFIDGNSMDRVFHILAGTVYMYNITIEKGRAAEGLGNGLDQKYKSEDGGGIYNNGTLILTHCALKDNESGPGNKDWNVSLPNGGHGGAIYNNNVLTLSECMIYENKAGAGGTGGTMAGNGGHGGGIYNAGKATLQKTYLKENEAGEAGATSNVEGASGNGGGIFNSGTMQLSDCSINENKCSGIINSGKIVLSNSTLWNNWGLKYGGGGIYNVGEASLTDCNIEFNTTEMGGGGCQQQPLYSGGPGAGIYNSATLTLSRCLIHRNTTGSARQVCSGNAGPGGGLYNIGNASLTNCTISENHTGDGVDSKNTANGGGIYSNKGLTLINCTVAYNTTGTPGTDTGVVYFGQGGGIYLNEPGAVIQNTIIANNQVDYRGEAPDCYGTFNSQGYNLIEKIEGCTITGIQTGNIIGQDAQLDSLMGNGGATNTHALLPGSPAIDAGYSPTSHEDQRGSTRPVDIAEATNIADGSDIGAYEFNTTVNSSWLYIDRTQLNYGIIPTQTSIAPQTIFIEQLGNGPFYWSASSTDPWISFSPASGSGDSLFSVSVNPDALAMGQHTGTITITVPGARHSPQTITVNLNIYNQGTTTAPFGDFATPLEGASLANSIPVTGWTLDDIGVASIKIYNGNTYIGDATFVQGARPDVEEAYPTFPNNDRAGWGYMLLTHFLPGGGNGTYTLTAKATDMEGNEVTLGSKTITLDNAHTVKPFGAIDTPTQGGFASGKNYVNFGWVLTPQPNSIPTDGSTIQVLINGVEVGQPVYNNYRSDIATLFPGYANSNGAVGYYYIDTTTLPNSNRHTISWIVTDSAGNKDGIGSRYFSVFNSSPTQAQSYASAPEIMNVSSLNTIPNDSLPVTVFSKQKKSKTGNLIEPDENGIHVLQSKELELLNINLRDQFSATSNFSGYLMVGDQLRALPVGSTLDSVKGIFYWQPGPGFLGQYNLVFIGKDNQGQYTRKSILVNINPL